jgi:hypothetical protein
MTTYAWIVCGLGVFDALIVVLWLLFLRSQTFLDRKSRIVTGLALTGFIVHAVLFFEGLILYLQLAMLAVIYISLAVWPSERKSVDGDRSQSF